MISCDCHNVMRIVPPVGKRIPFFHALRGIESPENVGNGGLKYLKSVMKRASELPENVGNSDLKTLKSVIYYPYFQAERRYS